MRKCPEGPGAQESVWAGEAKSGSCAHRALRALGINEGTRDASRGGLQAGPAWTGSGGGHALSPRPRGRV